MTWSLVGMISSDGKKLIMVDRGRAYDQTDALKPALNTEKSESLITSLRLCRIKSMCQNIEFDVFHMVMFFKAHSYHLLSTTNKEESFAFGNCVFLQSVMLLSFVSFYQNPNAKLEMKSITCLDIDDST